MRDKKISLLTDDAFLGGRLRILQPKKGYRAGLDAVILAASLPCEKDDHVFEAGIGTGVAALCLLSRQTKLKIVGMEISPDYAEICRENARRNQRDDALEVMVGDVCHISSAQLAPNSFEHAYANPPFYTVEQATASPHSDKARAHIFAAKELQDWISRLHFLLKPRGTLSLIYPTAGLTSILHALASRCRFGNILIAPIFPRHGAQASRLLIQAVKASRAPLIVSSGLVLHKDDHHFTEEAEKILRDGRDWKLR